MAFIWGAGGPGHDFNRRLGGLRALAKPGHRRLPRAIPVKPALRNSVVLALAQTGLLVTGILAVATSNRLAHSLGHPDLRDFLFFMNHGWLLLPLPVIWMAAAGRWLVARGARPSRETAVYTSGVLLLATLAGALLLDVAEPWRSVRTLPTEVSALDQ